MASANDNDSKKGGMNTGMKIAIGCVVVAAVCFLIIAVGILLLALNVKKVTAFGMSQVANQVIEASSLSPEEKADAKKVARQFIEDERIPLKDVEAIMQRLMEGPIGRIAIFARVQGAIQQSEWPQSQKQAAMQSVQMFINGVGQEVFSEDEIQTVMDIIPKDTDSSSGAGGAPQMGAKPPPWTDEELRLVLARMNDLLEGRQISSGATPPIPAGELREIIQAMREAIAANAPPEELPVVEPTEEPE